MSKYILAIAFVALTSTASLAAQEFYVVQDVKTKSCGVDPQKPDGTEKIMIGTAPYATRAEGQGREEVGP